MSRLPSAGDERIRVEVKRELRKRMRAVRNALPVAACEARSAAIAERVLSLTAYQSARVVLAFTAIRREVRTQGVIDAARHAGKDVALPRVVDERLELRAVDAGTELVEGAFGVPEPPDSAPRISPDAVDFALVPALAVDPTGHRIGYGGGYYDRLLPSLVSAVTCAVAFDFQFIAEVPRMPMDVPVNVVVTDTRILEVG